MRRGKNSSEAAGGESMRYGYPREGLRLSNPVVKTRRQKTLYFWRYRKKSKIQLFFPIPLVVACAKREGSY